jgi:hypothetical protein
MIVICPASSTSSPEALTSGSILTFIPVLHRPIIWTNPFSMGH